VEITNQLKVDICICALRHKDCHILRWLREKISNSVAEFQDSNIILLLHLFMQLYVLLICLSTGITRIFFTSLEFHNVTRREYESKTAHPRFNPIKWCVTWLCMQFPISSRLCTRDSRFRKFSSRGGRGSAKQRERAKNARDKSHVHELNKRCFPLASNSQVENCR